MVRRAVADPVLRVLGMKVAICGIVGKASCAACGTGCLVVTGVTGETRKT